MDLCNRRPSRSDEHLSLEKEAKLEEETRDYFDGIAPKRHTKPQRSEYSTQYVDAFPTNGTSLPSIPEYLQFQRLEKDDDVVVQKVIDNEKAGMMEEFVETEYYQDLNCIDKQHHTTGTGFISVENANGNNFSLESDSFIDTHASCKGNPATNDWVPAAPYTDTFASDKPKRSDN